MRGLVVVLVLALSVPAAGRFVASKGECRRACATSAAACMKAEVATLRALGDWWYANPRFGQPVDRREIARLRRQCRTAYVETCRRHGLGVCAR